MSAASAPAAKAAILTILQAAAGLTGVTVMWDQPTKDEDFAAPELVWLGNVTGDENWGMLGAQRRDEQYSIGLGVYVEQWGDNPQTLEARTWAIWGAATDALRTDLRTPGSLLRAAGVRQYDRITFQQRTGPATPEKWGARIDGTIELIASNV
jgi:hypothetical protein